MTVVQLIANGLLFPYTKALKLYKCPADRHLSPAQSSAGFNERVRSVSMNGFILGRALPGQDWVLGFASFDQVCRKAKSCYDSHQMIALEQIHQLSLREKLLAMEALWDEISREEQHLEVPQWHKEMLDERERLRAPGKARFVDWEQAKRQINEATQ